MSGVFTNLAAKLRALPDGAILRSVFYGLVGLATFLVAMDFRELVNSAETGSFAMPAQSPVRMDRPERDNQIRPYLPFTRPVAPDDDGLRLRNRRREENEAAPMHFRLGTHGSAFAEGTITPGTAESLADFLESDRAAGVTEIVLHSPGGSVTDATQMARMIREHGLATRVLADGYCASSCPLVFAGGTERIADATSWIGVHQVFALTTSFGSLGEGMDHAQRVSAETQDMLFEFGVDPRVWTRAMATAKEHLYLFTPDELLDLKLATKIEGSAEEPVAATGS